jgi:16S rRNA (uracil1498-N3)-methyltransferase
MTRKCFFVQKIDPDAGTVDLSPEASHHLENVLRFKAGERIEIRDGLGSAWTGEIAEIKKGRVAVRLLGKRDGSVFESSMEVSLLLGLARTDIMDLVIRQATELGIYRIAAFRAARSQYGLTGMQAGKKIERWSKIAREAVCQCGRTRMPEIAIFDNLEDLLLSLNEGDVSGELLKIVALERESQQDLRVLRESKPHYAGISAAIGPEGGWDDSEISRLIKAGFESVHLGPRILRYETAAIALISSIQLLWGDLGETKEREGDEDEMH